MIVSHLTVAAPEAEFARIHAALFGPAGWSVCGLVPLPSAMNPFTSADPLRGSVAWQAWMQENWGPVGGDGRTELVEDAAAEGMLRIRAESDCAFTQGFWLTVSANFPGVTLAVVTLDDAAGVAQAGLYLGGEQHVAAGGEGRPVEVLRCQVEDELWSQWYRMANGDA